MKNIIFTTIFIFLFSACSTSSLKLNKDGIIQLDFNNQVYYIEDEITLLNSINFKDLYIKQYSIKDDEGNMLFYEDATTDIDFEFNYGGLSTVMYIFDDSKKYEMVYKNNNLSLVQIMLKNSKYVNVMIQDGSTQEYKYIYGFTNKEFFAIASIIKSKDEKIKKLKFEAVTFNSLSKPITNWNDLLVFFTPLITPLRELSSF